MTIAIQFLFVLINIATAYYQAHRFAQGKTISHFLWAFYYCVLIAAAFYIFHNKLLCIACLVQRVPVFNTSLNLIRHKPFFYTGSASVLDRLFTGWYVVVFFLFIAALVTIQFYL